MVAALFAYIASVICVILTQGEMHLIAFLASAVDHHDHPGIVIYELRPIVRLINYMNLGTVPGHDGYISRYMASLVFITMFTASSVSFLFSIYWQCVLVLLLAYFFWFLFLMKVTYDRTCDTSGYVRSPKEERTTTSVGPAPKEKKQESLSSIIDIDGKGSEHSSSCRSNRPIEGA